MSTNNLHRISLLFCFNFDAQSLDFYTYSIPSNWLQKLNNITLYTAEAINNTALGRINRIIKRKHRMYSSVLGTFFNRVYNASISVVLPNYCYPVRFFKLIDKFLLIQHFKIVTIQK